jgi:hypothetical protein
MSRVLTELRWLLTTVALGTAIVAVVYAAWWFGYSHTTVIPNDYLGLGAR